MDSVKASELLELTGESQPTADAEAIAAWKKYNDDMSEFGIQITLEAFIKEQAEDRERKRLFRIISDESKAMPARLAAVQAMKTSGLLGTL
jgi:hypothetical protein